MNDEKLTILTFKQKQEYINEMIRDLQAIQQKNHAPHHKIEYQTRIIEKTIENLNDETMD